MSPIVVGVDGSEGATHALAWAASEARLRGSAVRIVHCWRPPFIGGFPLSPTPVDPQPYEDAAREVLAEAVGGADLSGIEKVDKKLYANGAATALLKESEDAELLVVGARGLGGFAGLLLGSVSAQVVHHARCPVVVIPASA